MCIHLSILAFMCIVWSGVMCWCVNVWIDAGGKACMYVSVPMRTPVCCECLHACLYVDVYTRGHWS